MTGMLFFEDLIRAVADARAQVERTQATVVEARAANDAALTVKADAERALREAVEAQVTAAVLSSEENDT